MTVSAPADWLMREEVRLLLRELVRLGGTDPETIAPAKPPWERSVGVPKEVQ